MLDDKVWMDQLPQPSNQHQLFGRGHMKIRGVIKDDYPRAVTYKFLSEYPDLNEKGAIWVDGSGQLSRRCHMSLHLTFAAAAA